MAQDSGHLESLRTALDGRYRIDREIGAGGMAIVYLAEDVRHDRYVAIKVLRSEVAAGLGSERFLREIKVTAQLTHPNVLALLDSGEAAGQLFYVMPFVEGESLRDRLERERQLPLDDVVRITTEVADALDTAHKQGVVHRDIKPENILISGGRAVVADFGIARALSEAGAERLTQTGIAVGTPLYMSPEQALGQGAIDGRSDVYSLACVTYEMLVGHGPFPGTTPQQILARHAMDPVPSLRTVRNTISEEAEAVVERGLAKVPADRFPTAGEFSRSLAAAVSAPLVQVDRRRLALTTAGVFALMSAALLAAVNGLTVWLGLPAWVLWTAAVLLAIGLPVVTVTALLEGPGPRRRAPVRDAHGTSRLLNWRAALLGGGLAFGGLGTATAAYVVMRDAGIGPIGTLIGRGALQEQDRLIIADFVNRTSDSVLAATVTNALRVDVGQSRAVIVLDHDREVVPGLRRMRRDLSLPLDDETARQVALREGAKAVVAGEVSAVGAGYLLSARIIGADSGNVLATVRVTARDDADLIAAIDRLSDGIRERVGESLRGIRASPELAEVTTSSLEALRLYSRAGGPSVPLEQRIRLLEEATSIDSNFATAQRVLSIRLDAAGTDPARADSLRAKAFRLRERLPEFERYMVEGNYWRMLGDDREGDAWRRALELRPNDERPLSWLGFYHSRKKEFDRAEHWFLLTYERTGGEWLSNVATQQLRQDKLDAARATIAKLKAEFPNARLSPYQAYEAVLAYRAGDVAASMGYWQALRDERRDYKALADMASAALLSLQGKDREANSRFNRGVASLNIAGWGANGARDYLGDLAWKVQVDAQLMGALTPGRQRLDEALRRFPVDSIVARTNTVVLLHLAMAYAAVDHVEGAKAVLARYDEAVRSQRPTGVPANQTGQMPLAVRGMIALVEGRSAAAVSELESLARGADPIIWTIPLYGRALEQAGQPDSAIAAYERYLTAPVAHPIGCCWVGEQPSTDALWRPWIHRRLGELYEARGDREKAVRHYTSFVTLWSDADPELQSQVQDVRKKLARLTPP